MKKKTFNINTLFDYTANGTLRDRLKTLINDTNLDQQDVVDIISTVNANIKHWDAFYDNGVRRQGHGFQTNLDSNNPTLSHTETSSLNEPEYYTQLFQHVKFRIDCSGVVLKEDFTFTGVDGHHLLYIGRDGETCRLQAKAIVEAYNIRVELEDESRLVNFRGGCGEISKIKPLVDQGVITLPGQPKLSLDALRIKKHYALSEWRNVTPGCLVKDVYDHSEVIYLVIGQSAWPNELSVKVQEVVLDHSAKSGLSFKLKDNPPFNIEPSRLTLYTNK